MASSSYQPATSRHQKMLSQMRSFEYHAPVFESLEARRHLSVGLSRGGTLFSTGTSGNDVISLVRNSRRASRLYVIENGIVTTVSAGSIRRINLSGGSGNDTITIDDTAGIVISPSITLDGGAGADRLNGGTTGATMIGGLGNDTIVGGAGADYVLGGNGNDAVWGGSGDDQLYGDSGDDLLYGQKGNDTLGGNGEDRVLFMGDNGDPDHLRNYPATELGRDLLDGGKGNDDLLCGTWSDTQHYDGTFDQPPSSTLIGGAGNDVLNARGPDAADPIQVLADQDINDVVPVASFTNEVGHAEVVHIHAILNIYIGGKLVELPTGIGNFGFPLIHTHPAEFNVVHFHSTSPHTFYLGEAFAAWGISMDATHIGRFRVGDGHTLTMEVERQGRGAFIPSTLFGDYAIQSTGEAKGDRRDVINIRYT